MTVTREPIRRALDGFRCDSCGAAVTAGGVGFFLLATGEGFCSSSCVSRDRRRTPSCRAVGKLYGPPAVALANPAPLSAVAAGAL